MALRFLLATRPAVLSEVLGVVHRTISGHLLARAGVRRVAGHTGAVTLIQRFGSALNLNVHFHMLFVDGVYVTEGSGAPVFRAVRSPGAGELQVLVQRLAEGIGRLLEKRGGRSGLWRHPQAALAEEVPAEEVPATASVDG